jgi:predicted dehydrogenase
MAELKAKKTAIIGCGMICGIYAKNLRNTFKITDLVGCADLIPERAKRSLRNTT